MCPAKNEKGDTTNDGRNGTTQSRKISEYWKRIPSKIRRLKKNKDNTTGDR